MLNDRVLGVAVVFSCDAPQTFTEAQIELAVGIASVVAPAIENARLHQKIPQLAIAEERARLAQELHDDVVQTLAATQFYASLAGDLLEQNELPRAKAALSALREMISQAYVGVREAIFDLRSMASLQVCGLTALQSYLAHYEQRYGLDVCLEADGEAAGVLAGAPGVQVFRILQEALGNVRKHGQTAQARVDLQREGPWVRISVQDDGQGFDPALVADQETPHFGLQIMRERAEKVGGTLCVESQPGRGTLVVLRVPFPQRGEAA